MQFQLSHYALKLKLNRGSSLRLFQRTLENRKFILLVWFGMAVYGAMLAISINQINNYIIFKHVYIHALQGNNLYIPYPGETTDVNLYGPVFSLVIAPFSWLPDKAGSLLWVVGNAGFLLFAILRLPVAERWKNVLILLSTQELMITSTSMQTNAMICACILLGFTYVRRGKEGIALFFIMLSAFIKIYGIVGLAFFFFSRKKTRFIRWALAWSILLFFAPLVIVHFDFLVQSYRDWITGLKAKAAKNILMDKGVLFQNVSVPGMVRRIFQLHGLNDALIIIPALIAFGSQYLRYKYFNDFRYQLYILCSVLIATVIFSTGSESATYIIAVPGMVLWYLLQPKSKWVTVFFVVAFVFTTFSYSDIFTPWSRKHLFRPYSLKALFPFVIWVIILIQVYSLQFLKAVHPSSKIKLVKV